MTNPNTLDIPLSVERLLTPVGRLVLVTDDNDCVRGLDWSGAEAHLERLLRIPARTRVAWRNRARPSTARRALEAYFDGALEALAPLAVVTNGTPFQQRVWTALRRIPVHQTMSYRQLAVAIGQPSAVRAVGLANGANPVSIIVPCHRVIGANGSLTGYGGGLERKRWLLAHEGAVQAGLG